MRDSCFGLVCRGASLIEVDDDRAEHLSDDGLFIEDGIPAVARMRGASVRRWLVDCEPSEDAIVTMLHDTPAHISISLRRCVSHSFLREARQVLRCLEPLFASIGNRLTLHLLTELGQRMGDSWQDIGGSHGDQVVARAGDLVVVSARNLEGASAHSSEAEQASACTS